MSEEELVGSGSFRVDRARALSKLERFQLPDPADFYLPWIRAAVSSGATRIELVLDRNFWLRFDGESLAEDALRDPFEDLFAQKGRRRENARHLAIGLLTALRLKPESVALASGAGARRRAIEYKAVEDTREVTAREGEERTVLRVNFGRGGPPALTREKLKRDLALCPVPVVFNGSAIAAKHPADVRDVHAFEVDGVRGEIWIPEPGDASRRLELHALGARVGRAEVALKTADLAGRVEYANFRLNASQSGVVRGAAFKKMKRVLEREAAKLVAAACADQRAHFPADARRVFDGGLRPWRAALEAGTPYASNSLFAGLREVARDFAAVLLGPAAARGDVWEYKIAWRARVTRWLRDVAVRRTGSAGAVDESPLFFGVGGEALSPRELREQAERLGYVPMALWPYPKLPLPFLAVWCASQHDLETLGRLFPKGIHELPNLRVDDNLAKMLQARKPASTALETGGFLDVVERAPFETADFTGEIGLVVDPRAARGRSYLIEHGKVDRFVEGAEGLRYSAVVALKRGREASAAALRALAAAADRAALSLYRRAAENYSCWEAHAKNVARREHLLDLLTCGARPDPWLLEVPLFDGRVEWWSAQRLRQAVAERAPLYLIEPDDERKDFMGRPVLAEKRLLGHGFERCLGGIGRVARHAVRGTRGVWRVHRAHPVPPKDLQDLGFLFAYPLGGTRTWVAVTEVPGATASDFGWGRVWLRPESGAPPAGLDGAAARAFGVEVLIAFLERWGALHDRPEDPRRRFLLTACAMLLGPWIPMEPYKPARCLFEFLSRIPFFPGRGAAGGLPLAALANLGPDGLVSCPRGAKDPPEECTLELDGDELRLIRRLWPQRPELLRRAGGGGAEDLFPERLAIKKPALFKRRYRGADWSAELALLEAADEPRVVAFSDRGERRRLDAAALQVSAEARLETLGEPDPERAAQLLAEAYARFLGDLAAAWPVHPVGTDAHAALCARVLGILRREPAADPRLRSLPLVPTWGGGMLTLERVRRDAMERARLVYTPRRTTPVPPDAADVPVLTDPAAVLGLIATGAPITAAAWPEWARETAPAPVLPEPEPGPKPKRERRKRPREFEPPVFLEVRRLVRELRNARRGAGDAGLPHNVGVRTVDGKRTFYVTRSGSWEFDVRSPLVRGILESPLDDRAKAAYLVSAALSSANRKFPEVADADDVAFQAALAALLARP